MNAERKTAARNADKSLPGQQRNPRVLTRFVATTVSYLRGQGISMEAITEATGVKRIELLDLEDRMSEDVIPKLWRLAEPASGDLSPALHMMSVNQWFTLGPCENLIRYADTLQSACEALLRFATIVTDSVQVRLLDDRSPFGIQFWHPLDELDGGNAAEVGVSSLFRLIEECQGQSLLDSVDFAHAPLGEISGYQRFFGATVRFQQKHNTLFFRREALTQPMLQADEHLFRYVQANLELMQDRWILPGDRNLLSQIYEAVRINAELGRFSAEELAITLRLNLRKLQREAKRHGLTVSGILEEAREVTAKKLLSDSNLDMEQIAARLDYADSRAFRRAFQRWTGESPASFRNRTT